MNQEGEIAESTELLALATPQVYRRNLFRVLGVPVTATPDDVRRQQRRRDMQRKLGVETSDEKGGTLALVPPATDEEIQAALNRFADPQGRLLDEMFWFWPLDGNAAADAGLRALEGGRVKEAADFWLMQVKANGRGQIAVHNLAVLSHMAALDDEASLTSGSLKASQTDRLPGVWSGALSRWRLVLDGDDVWSRVRDRVRELNDVRLTTGLVRRLRNTLPKMLLLINAMMARAAAERQDADGARRHAQIVRDAAFPDGLADAALREALQPIRDRLKVICEKAKECGERDREGAAQIARDVAEKVRPLLAVVDLILPTDDPTCRAIHDEAALAMDRCCTLHCNQVQDAAVTVELLELILGIALGDSLRERLKKELADFRELASLSQCFFCGKRPGDDECKHEVAMYGNVNHEYYGNTIRTTWSHTKIAVSRCKACKAAHDVCASVAAKYGCLGFFLAAPVALVVAGLAFATGADSGEEAEYFFGGGGVVGVIVGGITAAIMADRGRAEAESQHLDGIRPFSAHVTHPRVEALLAENWAFGEKPE